MLGLDDGGEGGVPLAEVIGGVERGHGLHLLVVPQLIGKLIDGERPRHGEPVPLLEPQLPPLGSIEQPAPEGSGFALLPGLCVP
ncbi:hypothetical protein GCM10010332_31790 [Streptomyces albogriseolus]|nr:hypothetical protein GCM10010332_31790 [Streptomyces albogriseolus]